MATLPENAIVVARSMGPAALLDYDRSTAARPRSRGGRSDQAISPSLRARSAFRLSAWSDNIAALGRGGRCDHRRWRRWRRCMCARSPMLKSPLREKARLRARRQEQYRKLRDLPSVTKDGVRGRAPSQCRPADRSAASLTRRARTGSACSAPNCSSWSRRACRRPPSRSRFIGCVFQAVNNRPVTFRTLDIGGDKVLPYMRANDEENPALGWRAIRIGLDRPGLLRAQLRAMMKAVRRPAICASCFRWSQQ